MMMKKWMQNNDNMVKREKCLSRKGKKEIFVSQTINRNNPEIATEGGCT